AFDAEVSGVVVLDLLACCFRVLPAAVGDEGDGEQAHRADDRDQDVVHSRIRAAASSLTALAIAATPPGSLSAATSWAVSIFGAAIASTFLVRLARSRCARMPRQLSAA